MERDEFAKQLKELRAKAGLSWYDLAQLVHSGAGTISRWENEHAAPPEVARVAIIKLLNEYIAKDKANEHQD